MNFLKRAGWSLWRHKFKNVVLTVVFSVIFAVTLVSFMVYSTTSYQVEITQKAVANAVTLEGPIINGIDGSSAITSLGAIEADRFVNTKLASRHNIVLTDLGMDVLSAKPKLKPEDEAGYQEFMDVVTQDYDAAELSSWVRDIVEQASKYIRHPEENPGYVYESQYNEETGQYTVKLYSPKYSKEQNEVFQNTYNALSSVDDRYRFRVTAISDSEYFDNFSSGGYALIDGTHFKAENEAEDIILISQEVAEINHLKVGDTMKLQFAFFNQEAANFAHPHAWELKVGGIFAPPDTSFSKNGYTASNFVYVPYQAMKNYCRSMYDDALLWFPMANRATVYVDDPEDVDAFIQETYDKFKIVEMSDQSSAPTGTNIEGMLSDGTFGTSDPEETAMKFAQFIMGAHERSPYFTLLVDRGWYKMVAQPLEQVSTLTLVMGIGLLAGAFVVLLLICILTVRKRKKEFGILLSMGEKRPRLFLQVFLEQAVPLLLAVVIGFGVGVPFASVFGNDLLNGRAAETNSMYQNDKQAYLEDQLGGNDYTVEMTQTIRSSANVSAQTQMQFRLDYQVASLYFAAAFVLLFVTVLVQMLFLLRLSPARILARRN